MKRIKIQFAYTESFCDHSEKQRRLKVEFNQDFDTNIFQLPNLDWAICMNSKTPKTYKDLRPIADMVAMFLEDAYQTNITKIILE